MCFNQRGDISTLNGSSLKLVDKFTFLGSSISSTERSVNTQQAKALTAIDRLSVIWNSDWSNKIKRIFLPSGGCVDTVIWMHYMDANETSSEKAWRKLHKNAARNIEQILDATPNQIVALEPPTTHHDNYPS